MADDQQPHHPLNEPSTDPATDPSGATSRNPPGSAAREAALAECLRWIGHRPAVPACPRCAGTSLYRHGVVNGLQRYRCRACGRTFNALTNTPLAWLRLPEKWLPFLRCMGERHTIRKAADTIGVHMNTSFRWRHRFQGQLPRSGAPEPSSNSPDAVGGCEDGSGV